MSAIPESTIRALAFAEADFAHLDGRMRDLSAVLALCSVSVPRCGVASRQITKLRRMLRHVLEGVEPEITAAVSQVEKLEPAPF